MSQMSDSESSESEHELSIFKRVNNRLGSMHEKQGYKVRTNTNLARALDKLASTPFLSFPLSCYTYSRDIEIRVKGEEAGTWMSPDVSVFQKHATPSPFGRGEETVIDPSYRNGTELKADDLSFWNSTEFIEQKLKSAMFIGKRLRIKLYKLAIYEEGGHFNWHRDSTHSDAHHGTVLFALNTEWEGGEFMLRHGGVEVNVDMHPLVTTTRFSESEPEITRITPIVVAFYTDMEHKVMPVTKGVRLVLQYDVEVVGEDPAPSSHQDLERPLDIVAGRTEYLDAGRITTYPQPDDTSIQAVINEIKELHNKGTNIVAFPLFHLYRRASVKREYLKGNDSVLFDALKDHFDVSVDTLIIFYDEDEGLISCNAYRYSAVPEKEEDFANAGSEEENFADAGSEEESSSDNGFTYDHKSWVMKFASFHLPRASAIQQVLEQQLDWLGNESQRVETRYYGAGMFVKPKKETGSSVHVHERSIGSNSDDEEGKEVKKRRVA